jgi:hypothetical protein
VWERGRSGGGRFGEEAQAASLPSQSDPAQAENFLSTIPGIGRSLCTCACSILYTVVLLNFLPTNSFTSIIGILASQIVLILPVVVASDERAFLRILSRIGWEIGWVMVI